MDRTGHNARRRRLGLTATFAAAMIGGSFTSAAPIAAAAAVDCTWQANHRRVTVSMSGASIAELSVSRTGRILVNGNPCAAGATVNSTEDIVIDGDSADQLLRIRLGTTGFRPGFTNEPGNSDEIEFLVSSGNGDDTVAIYGRSQADDIQLGVRDGLLNTTVPNANLNANETTGIDSDLIIGHDAVEVYGMLGGDVVSGAGGAGTGKVFPNRLYIDGGEGNDTLTGGRAYDRIVGGPGADELFGGVAGDLLVTLDNESGNDRAYGGKGSDKCMINNGDAIYSCTRIYP